MAAVYPKTLEKMWKGQIDADTGDVKMAVVGSGYVYDAAHEFLDDVTDILATTANLTTKDFTDGVFSADEPSATGAASDVFTGVVTYIDTGVAGTSELLCFEDRDPLLNPLNYTTAGGAETINLSAGRIASI